VEQAVNQKPIVDFFKQSPYTSKACHHSQIRQDCHCDSDFMKTRSVKYTNLCERARQRQSPFAIKQRSHEGPRKNCQLMYTKLCKRALQKHSTSTELCRVCHQAAKGQGRNATPCTRISAREPFRSLQQGSSAKPRPPGPQK